MKRILSGITPSGDGSLHIGNYLGAVKQFAELARNNDCFLFVADLHALTTVQNRELLKKNTETLILNELALLMGELGEDLPNVTFFRQSDIPLHAELQTILNNVTPLGLLKRAHAYKDKLAKDVMEDEINLGLFNYPILMAADILLYKPDLVPVGKDQKQHIEITRDIAERFNKIYKKNVFKLPEPHIPEEVAVVLGTDGKRKMSKSLGNIISIFESEEVIRKQVNSTFTDPTRIHVDSPGHIEGNMVFAYLEHFGDPTSSTTSSGLRGASKVEQLKELYREGKVSDVEVKDYLFTSLMKTFAQARKHYQTLKNSPGKVKQILENGAARAHLEATLTMKEVRDAVGLTNQYSFFGYNAPQPSFFMKRGSGGVVTSRDDKTITIDDFAKVEMRVGLVQDAINVPKSEKLIRLTVDFGPSFASSSAKASKDEKSTEGKREIRTIFTGVRTFGYTPEDFTGKKYIFIVNLKPRKMPSYVETPAGKIPEESQGMILAVDGLELPFGQHGAVKPVFVAAENLPVGAKVR